MAFRCDTGALGAFEPTPSGGVRVRANISRASVLEYSDGNGKSWREYVAPDEAFRPDSLATLADAAVTRLHPPRMVTKDTYKAVAIGHARDGARQDGAFVSAVLVVEDADAIAAIERGELRECSAGYVCDVDPTPGVTPDGQRFDAIQRNRRYNHVALGPAGWGRAGSDVALRMDAAGATAFGGDVGYARTDAATPSASPAAAARATEPTMKTIKFGKREYRCDDATDMAALQSDADAAGTASAADATSKGAQIDQLIKQVSDLMAQLAVMGAKVKALEDVEATEDDPDAEVVPEEVLDAAGVKRDPKKPLRVHAKVLDALLARRDALRTDAARVLGKTDLTGKSAREIKHAVLAKLMPTFRLDAFDAAQIDAMYVGAIAASAHAAPRNDALGALHATAVRATRVDADDELAAGYAAMNTDLIERGRRPLGTAAK